MFLADLQLLPVQRLVACAQIPKSAYVSKVRILEVRTQPAKLNKTRSWNGSFVAFVACTRQDLSGLERTRSADVFFKCPVVLHRGPWSNPFARWCLRGRRLGLEILSHWNPPQPKIAVQRRFSSHGSWQTRGRTEARRGVWHHRLLLAFA